jgi:hypothetical protein
MKLINAELFNVDAGGTYSYQLFIKIKSVVYNFFKNEIQTCLVFSIAVIKECWSFVSERMGEEDILQRKHKAWNSASNKQRSTELELHVSTSSVQESGELNEKPQ